MSNISKIPSPVLWFTGLSGAGKTTLCTSVRDSLIAEGAHVEILDGDIIRSVFTPTLGFAQSDRESHASRLTFLADILARNGITVLVACISPYRQSRERARGALASFVEVYVAAPVEVCEARDTKGLYRLARAGMLNDLPGINSPYEVPVFPELTCETALESVEESTHKVLHFLNNLHARITQSS